VLSVNASTFVGNIAASGSGGGINNDTGTLTVNASTFSGNSAGFPGGGGIYNYDPNGGSATATVITSTLSGNSAVSGGGILNDGSNGGSAMLSVNACTFNGNSASTKGGGIANDGISGTATSLVATCTFSTNTAINGGGICNAGASSTNATLRVNASTLSGNSASGDGGSIFNDGSSAGHATLEIGDTILTRGTSGSNITNALGTVISHGYNLSSDGGGGFLTATGDRTNTNPLLGPLRNNGGPTFTHALQINSPAVDQGKRDAIPSLALTTDQRSAPRPFDFPTTTDASGGDGSDIGAFELGRPTLNIQKSATNAVLSWESYYGDFRLQSVTNVIASNGWTNVAGTPAVVANQYVLTNGPISENRFYRLKGN
jgi:predicted outer membrane repeat protein